MLPSEIVYAVWKPKQSLIKPKCKACEFYEALHTSLKSHRSQRCGVKLIDTHSNTVAVMVSYTTQYYMYVSSGTKSASGEFLVNTIVVHMK